MDIPGNVYEITPENTGLNKTQTPAFIKAIAKWRNDAAKIRTEVKWETEEVAVNTDSVGELIENGIFTESWKGDLRRACKKD